MLVDALTSLRGWQYTSKPHSPPRQPFIHLSTHCSLCTDSTPPHLPLHPLFCPHLVQPVRGLALRLLLQAAAGVGHAGPQVQHPDGGAPPHRELRCAACLLDMGLCDLLCEEILGAMELQPLKIAGMSNLQPHLVLLLCLLVTVRHP